MKTTGLQKLQALGYELDTTLPQNITFKKIQNNTLYTIYVNSAGGVGGSWDSVDGSGDFFGDFTLSKEEKEGLRQYEMEQAATK